MEIFKFVWKIENYNFVPCYRGKFLKSPVFNVKNLGSTFLELYPKGDFLDPGHDSLIVNLKYCSKFVHATISCDVEMVWGDTKTKFIVEKVYNTKWKCRGEKRNSVLLIDIEEEENKVVNEFERATLVVTCCFNENLSDNSMHMSKDLNALSKDLESAYMNRQSSDLILRAGTEEFHVHRVIIFGRIPKLYAQLLEENKEKMKKKFKDKFKEEEVLLQDVTLDIEPSVLSMLLNYVYSGKVEPSVSVIPAGLYKFAELYEMTDLREKLCTSPDQITARTCIRIDHNIFRWRFGNLYNYKVNHKLYSPAFSGGSVPCSDLKMECYVVKVYAGQDVDPLHQYVERLEIRFHRLFKGDSIYVKCKITVEELPYLKMTDEYVFNDNEVWQFPSFIEFNLAKHFLRGNHERDTAVILLKGFTLKCEFYISGSAPAVVEGTECTTAQFGDYVARGSNVINLSDDIGSLYNIFLPKMADVSFQINQVKFPAHKVILAARSPVFARMFEHDMLERMNGVINIDDIDVATLNLLLSYMYFGKVEFLNYESVVALYRVADKYEVISLKELCVLHLKGILSLSNVCDLLVLADIHSDDNFRKIVIDFICVHANVILNSPEWKEIIDSRVELASEVLHCITRTILTMRHCNCASIQSFDRPIMQVLSRTFLPFLFVNI